MVRIGWEELVGSGVVIVQWEELGGGGGNRNI